MYIYCMFYYSFVFNYTPPITSRFTYAGHRSCYCYERWTCIRSRLAAFCTNLRQSAVYLRQFTIVGCRGLFLCMFKNKLRSSWSSALICGNTSHLATLSAVCLSLTCVNMHSSALLGVQGRQTDAAQWNASIKTR